jgi:hypothetical protein
MARHLAGVSLGVLRLFAFGWLAGAALRRSAGRPRPPVTPSPAPPGVTGRATPARPPVPFLDAEELRRLAERAEAWW